jgi:hypothetical protein
MTPDEHDNRVRRGALDMIAAGNSIEAVAGVFGVSVALLRHWQEGDESAAAAGFEAPTQPAATDAADSRRPGQACHWTGAGRFALLGFAALMPALAAGARVFYRVGHPGAAIPLLLTALTAAGLLLSAYLVVHFLRAGFELTATEITAHGAFTARTLALSDIAGYRLRWRPKARAYVVTLQPRAVAAPTMKVNFREEEARTPRIAGWLASMHNLGSEQVESARGQSPGRGIKTFYGLLACLPVLLILGSSFNDLRIVVDGPPAFDRLERIDGRLLDARCGTGKSRGWATVRIATSSGDRQIGLPCQVNGLRLDRTTASHITVYRDERRFADDEAYEVDLDGIAQESYAQHNARKQPTRGPMLAMHFFMLLLLLMAAIEAIGKSPATGRLAPPRRRSGQ